MALRFAIALPQYFSHGEFEPGRMREYLTRAEELGFESAWTTEQTLGGMPHFGPLETLAYAAACTGTLRLGCAVFVSSQHSPVHLAKSIATVDQLSGGRLEVGVGVGGRGRALAAFGVDPETLVSRFTEGIDLMKALWTRPTIDFDGRFWQLQGAMQEPKPFQRPHPPLWMGGSHPNAIRRAVRYGDGFFGAGSTTTEKFAEQVQILRKVLADSGRRDFPTAKRVYIAVDDDASVARRRISDALDRMYGTFAAPGTFAPVSVAGTPDDVVAGLREVADAGAELILLNPMERQAEQMERLAAEVIPRL
ncbi:MULTISPECIES: LLM class flavin-dependent oxidoreductase [unclassified Nocardia]|uniref:LLM class flavin-dependent oxidoreductase n=1 Tax=unclassified Nocardia TaxID=2637762 RepID=UPI001CE46DB6|nr:MULTISPECIES: LLM class flavin-dependent oxidoreductase [unclassified Nocardia]